MKGLKLLKGFLFLENTWNNLYMVGSYVECTSYYHRQNM